VRAFRALEQFDVERPFAPWLYRIATNTCVGLLRKRRPDVFSLDAMPEYEAETALAAASADTDPCSDWSGTCVTKRFNAP